MQKISLVGPLGLLLCTAPVLLAQAKPAASATANAPKGAHPRSAAEANALKALDKLTRDPTTTPDALDAAITGFVTQYPQSDYISSVETYGLEYSQTSPHVNYERSLVYGEAAIKADPTNVFALVTIGDIIPNQVKDTDLDRDQRIKEAVADDNAAIQLAQTSGDTIHGQPFTATQKSQTQGIAYSSLARIATLNKDYPGAVANYAKAIPLDPPEQQAVDYFYTARAQIEMKQYTQALASLDACSKAAPDNATIQAAVASNRHAIAQLQAAGGGN